MGIDSETRQRLLELTYHLLSDDDAAALRYRIASDPVLARAYEETQCHARLLAEAGRLSAPRISRGKSRRGKHRASRSGSSSTPAQRHSEPRSYRTRIAYWVVHLAAAALLAVSLGGYVYHRTQLTDLAAEHLRLVVTGPSRLQAGVGGSYRVHTAAIHGEPLPSQVEFAISAPGGKELLRQKEQTDDQGWLQLSIPADLNVPHGAQLEVVATNQDHVERMTQRVAVDPERYDTCLAIDRPWYRPGETIYYRSLTLSRYGLAADREDKIQYELRDARGAAVADSLLIGTTKRGVGNGLFHIPAEQLPGTYTLVARSTVEAFPERRQTILIRPARSATTDNETVAAKPASPQDRPAAAGKIRVQLFPEGGTLVAGLENRVYFFACDARGKPVALRGKIVDSRDAPAVAADVETSSYGMGMFAFVPAANESYRFQSATASDWLEPPTLPPVERHGIVLHADAGAFAADRPLECRVQAVEARRPLVVAVRCRGVTVSEQTLVTRAGVNPVTLALPDEAGGVLCLTVYDYHRSPPQPLAERLVYRKPARALRLHVAEHPDRFAPGDRVSLGVSVTNEGDDPVAATLGAAVVDEEAFGPRPAAPTPPDYFLLTGQLNAPAELESIGIPPPDDDKAALALDLLLGTQGWRSFVARGTQDHERMASIAADDAFAPPALFDNLEVMRARYAESLEAFHRRHTVLLRTVTTVSFFGGFGLLLLVAMMSLLRIASSLRLWIVAAVATACCVVVGSSLMLSDSLQPGDDGAVPFATYAADNHAPAASGVRDAPASGNQAAGDDAADAPRPAPPAASADPRSAAASPAAKNEEEHPPAESAAGDHAERPFPLRRYAYLRPSGAHDPADRPPTIFWHPLLMAGNNGRAQLEFELPETPGAYRVNVSAHVDGRLGAAHDRLVSRMPFAAAFHLPGELTVGDQVHLPVTLSNDTAAPLPVELGLEHVPPIKVEGAALRRLELPPQQSKVEWFALAATGPKADATLTLRASGEHWSRADSRPLRVLPPGIPQHVVRAGLLEDHGEVEFTLPPQWAPGSLVGRLTLAPNPLASMQQALAGSADSAALEAVLAHLQLHEMILRYLADHRVASTSTVHGSRTALESGRAKLAEFVSSGGYAEFPHGPADSVWTAWAVLHQRRAADLLEIRSDYGAEAGRWLAAQCDPEGHYRASAAGITAAPEVGDAFIAWARSAAGERFFGDALKPLTERAATVADPLPMALLAATLFNNERAGEAVELLARLAKKQAPDGAVDSQFAGIGNSDELTRRVETTALAAAAWAQSDAHRPLAQKACRWLLDHRQGNGTFGPPLATWLAMRALVQNEKPPSGPPLEATIELRQGGADGAVIAQRSLRNDALEPIVLEGWESHLAPGANRLGLHVDGPLHVPYVLAVDYYVDRAAEATGPLAITSRLTNLAVPLGQSAGWAATVTNNAAEALPLTIASFGLPAGLEPIPEQLAKRLAAGLFDAYEIRGRQILLYWRTLPAKKTISIELDLRAMVPGHFTGPASHAWILNQPVKQCWADPLSIEVTALY